MADSPPTSGASADRSAAGLGALLTLTLVFAVALARTAWLSDDAYITFRSVDHLLAGRGPVWNAGERVQAFTHPLWFGLVAAARAVTGEFYVSVLGLSMVLSMAAVGGAALFSRGPWPRRALVLALCCSSRAFVDYSTSGLENPLSHLLLALFFAEVLRAGEGWSGGGRFFRLVLPAALGVLTRHDALLIYAPVLAAQALRITRSGADGRVPGAGWGHLLVMTLAGLLPFLAWEAFSLLYYGFPFPNTAYAKLSTGVPRVELLIQGLHYLSYTLEHDPLTPAVILAGLIAGAVERDGRLRALAVGLGLYLMYVVWIGGDFMGGRFFALPFWGAALLLMNATPGALAPPLRWAGAAGLLIVAAASTFFVSPKAPLLSGPGYPNLPMEGRSPYDWRGISDERGGYYPWTGLLRADRDLRSPERQPWARMGRQFHDEGTPVVVQPAVGLMGWQAAERTMIVDANALTDPLLARLPSMQEPKWRIGHFTRVPPPGYLATLVLGENRIADPGIAGFYEDLRLVTRGPLWSRQRMRAIVRLNLEKQPGIADRDFYRAPPGYAAPARRHYPAEGFGAGGRERILPGADSFALYWREAGVAPVIEIAPPPTSDYDVELARGGTELGRFLMAQAATQKAPEGADASGAVQVRLPADLAHAPYDTLRLFPRGYAETQTFRMIRRIGEAGVPASPEMEEGRAP